MSSSCESEIVFELLGGGDGAAAAHGRIRTRRMRLCKDVSDLKRLKWVGDCSSDCWDRELLFAAKEAAAGSHRRGCDHPLMKVSSTWQQGVANAHQQPHPCTCHTSSNTNNYLSCRLLSA